jgi:Tol biopolymer transport system component
MTMVFCAGKYGDGARIVLIDPDGSSRVLTPDFHSACDPDVAFDGSKFLFAGKRSAGDDWNIFEMTLAIDRSAR